MLIFVIDVLPLLAFLLIGTLGIEDEMIYN